METTSQEIPTTPQPPVAPARPSLAERGRLFLRAHLWALPVLLALIVVRALLIHGDPSDFPQDRNFTAAFNIERLTSNTAVKQFNVDTGRGVLSVQDEAPEFPFVPVSAWLLHLLGLNPLVAARLFSLAAAVLTGAGLYVLGRRLGGAALGLTTLWLFALDPLAVFMGRTMLPDTFMVAAMVWSLVAAGAGTRGGRWRLALWMAIWLVVAALAKLSAIFFAPVAAVALMQALGWRRKSAWASLIVAAGATYLIVCLWYRIIPWSPLAGLRRISEHTNNVMASWSDIIGTAPMQVVLSRTVLALTLPGVMLMLVGWLFLQIQPGRRLWLNTWLVMSLFFVAITIKANTYWAYALTPVGCLLASVALVELCRIGRWRTLLPLALVALPAFWMCPSLRVIKGYLTVHPEYKAMSEVAGRQIKHGTSVLYFGSMPRDIAYFVRRPGLSLTKAETPTILSHLRGGDYRYLLSNRMAGDEAMADLFFYKPILETHAGRYVLFENQRNASLGEVVAPASLPAPPLNLDLAGQLKIVSLAITPERITPGAKVQMNVVFEKGPKYEPQPNLMLEFVHQPTGEAFVLEPISGGAVFQTWRSPLMQTPDFQQGPVKRMRYGFEFSTQMPAGLYKPRFTLLADRRRKLLLGEPQTAELTLQVLPPAALGDLPQTIDPAACIWVSSCFVPGTSWTGQAKETAWLTSDGHMYARPNLAPGDYDLVVTGSGLPAGTANDDNIWPILRLQKPGMKGDRQEGFPSATERTVKIRFRWLGPQDFLHLSIANPKIDQRARAIFPLYLDDITAGSRSVVLSKIEVRPASGS